LSQGETRVRTGVDGDRLTRKNGRGAGVVISLSPVGNCNDWAGSDNTGSVLGGMGGWAGTHISGERYVQPDLIWELRARRRRLPHVLLCPSVLLFLFGLQMR